MSHYGSGVVECDECGGCGVIYDEEDNELVCEVCKGEGTMECKDCGGEGSCICGHCSGSGEGMYDGSRCWVCHGSGERPCSTCSGEDEYYGYGW